MYGFSHFIVVNFKRGQPAFCCTFQFKYFTKIPAIVLCQIKPPLLWFCRTNCGRNRRRRRFLRETIQMLQNSTTHLWLRWKKLPKSMSAQSEKLSAEKGRNWRRGWGFGSRTLLWRPDKGWVDQHTFVGVGWGLYWKLLLVIKFISLITPLPYPFLALSPVLPPFVKVCKDGSRSQLFWTTSSWWFEIRPFNEPFLASKTILKSSSSHNYVRQRISILISKKIRLRKNRKFRLWDRVLAKSSSGATRSGNRFAARTGWPTPTFAWSGSKIAKMPKKEYRKWRQFPRDPVRKKVKIRITGFFFLK